MARIYRQAPLNAIWEGSGNVICLDVLRALRKEPDSATALFGEFRVAAEVAAASGDSRLVAAGNKLEALSCMIEGELREATAQKGQEAAALALESGARRFVDHLGLALQASSLIRGADASVAAAFCEARLGPREQWTPNLGGLATSTVIGREAEGLLLRRASVSPLP